MTAPDRIWIMPTYRSNGVDDFYLLDPKFRGNRGTEYVRADVVARLVGQIKAIAAAYDRDVPIRTADWHGTDCDCLRCAIDNARAALASEPRA